MTTPGDNGPFRRLVLVSGPPGSGKSTLAGPLAARLGFPLLAKDRIKESLHDGLGGPPRSGDGLDFSRRLGAAAMELLWALAADAPAAVLDANFWSGPERHRGRISALSPRPVEVFCDCPLAVCVRRYEQRRASRHPVHMDGLRGLDEPTFARSARPVGLGPVITVDTTVPVDVGVLASAVLAGLESPRPVVAGATPLVARSGGVSSS